jgi:hypothetical protein
MPLAQYRLGALDKSLINGTAQSVAARLVAAGATAVRGAAGVRYTW